MNPPAHDPAARADHAARVLQLGYLVVEVSDLAGWETFATEVIGAQIGDRDPDGTTYLRLDERHHRVALRPGDADQVTGVGWQVASEVELAELVGRLERAGYEVERPSADLARQRRVVGLAQLRDPDGRLTELFHGPLEPDDPFCSPRRMSGTFKTGSMGLGHIAGSVGDLEESLRFYRDVLGFEVSDYGDARGYFPGGGIICFLRCNPRHHSIAFGASPNGAGLHHWLVEVTDLDDVGRTLDLVQERGIPITQTLGRHNNDHMVSVYFQTPSGFEIEYGWGGRLLDADHRHPVVTRAPADFWGHKRPRAR